MKAIIEALKTLIELPRYLFAVFMVVISWWLADHLGPPDEGPKKLKPGKVDYYSKLIVAPKWGYSCNADMFCAKVLY